MIVTYYKRPNGTAFQIEAPSMRPTVAEFFEENNIKVSFEEDGYNGYILYADYGATYQDEPDEAIVFTHGSMTLEEGWESLMATTIRCIETLKVR